MRIELVTVWIDNIICKVDNEQNFTINNVWIEIIRPLIQCKMCIDIYLTHVHILDTHCTQLTHYTYTQGTGVTWNGRPVPFTDTQLDQLSKLNPKATSTDSTVGGSHNSAWSGGGDDVTECRTSRCAGQPDWHLWILTETTIIVLDFDILKKILIAFLGLFIICQLSIK